MDIANIAMIAKIAEICHNLPSTKSAILALLDGLFSGSLFPLC